MAAGSMAALLALVIGLIVWIRAADVAPAVPTRPTLIAVLPFRDLSPTPSTYLAEGLTDQLNSTLGQIQALRLTAPSSVARFSGRETASDEIVRQLRVDALVDGTITALPSAPDEPLRARVDLRIIQAGAAAPIYAGSFDWMAGDGRSLQAGLANAIAGAVKAAIRPGEAGRLASARQTNPNAEQAYFQGRQQLATYGPEGARRALQMFERAVSLDPQHAAAYAGASRAYVVLGQFGAISQGEARQSAMTAARTALEIDPELADAYVAMADLKFYFDWDWDGAERQYHKGLELNPSLPVARRTYAEVLAMRRRFPEALTQARLAVELDPASGAASLTNAIVLMYARRYQEAEAIVQDTLREHPDSAGAYVINSRLAELRGDMAEAIDTLARGAQLSSGGGVPVRVTALQLQARAGNHEEARAGLASLEAEAAKGAITLTHRDRAFVKLWLGDVDGACDEYQRAFDDRESGLMWIAVDPRVDALRQDPRFQSILKRMRLN
jgi:TolB-like protein/Tfp pilus assembly protein PilF